MQKQAIKIIRKECPVDVMNIVMDKQNDMKKGCNCLISMESAVIKIIREWKEGISPQIAPLAPSV